MPVGGPVLIKLHRKEDAEILQLGAVTCFLLEDGSRTENRVAAVVMMIPPGAKGPPMHWARMHDELFFVTQGSFSKWILHPPKQGHGWSVMCVCVGWLGWGLVHIFTT